MPAVEGLGGVEEEIVEVVVKDGKTYDTTNIGKRLIRKINPGAAGSGKYSEISRWSPFLCLEYGTSPPRSRLLRCNGFE